MSLARHLLTVVLLFAPGRGLAQDAGTEIPLREDGRTGVPTLEVIQNRKYQLAHEITLLGGGLPADPYTKGVSATVGYTMHFSPSIAWEIVHFTYAYNFDSKLKKEVLRIAGNIGAKAPSFPEIEWFAASHLVVKPLYGKEAIFNTDVIHLEAYLQAGPAVIRTAKWRGVGGKRRKRLDFGLDLGAGLRLWLSRATSLRLDIGELVYLFQGTRGQRTKVKQALHLHAGVAFNLRGED